MVAVRAPEGDFRDWQAIDSFAADITEPCDRRHQLGRDLPTTATEAAASASASASGG